MKSHTPRADYLFCSPAGEISVRSSPRRGLPSELIKHVKDVPRNCRSRLEARTPSPTEVSPLFPIISWRTLGLHRAAARAPSRSATTRGGMRVSPQHLSFLLHCGDLALLLGRVSLTYPQPLCNSLGAVVSTSSPVHLHYDTQPSHPDPYRRVKTVAPGRLGAWAVPVDVRLKETVIVVSTKGMRWLV